MKRAYKLQEFVAHSADVNCVRIGKKSSRVVVTGGEDHKVNMWAIGKPNAIMSLSGHTSAVESVTFDASEALVVAGAASGTIKLWDLEEAKIVRTFTGHRSNCIAVDFHPFGEFFASGSLDTNLKIWDIRRKNCIHTYKGHTRGVNCIKFSPDGRWVVSGGEDNIVKLWDLTAGKLLHDFKNHEGQILCLDYHPHEFLLATGSADRTVKFWDLETFELIGSAGSEASGIRSMIFNPDGRTLLAGLHESMKVFSWEPLRCHDVVDVGWSKLADLNVHEGKLLGCSFNQNCVGIWVVDLSRLGPYTAGSTNRASGTGGNLVSKPTSHVSEPAQQLIDGNLKSSNVTRNPLPQSLESSMKEMKLSSPTHSARSVPCTPQRSSSTPTSKVSVSTSATAPTYVMTPKRTGTKVQPSLVLGMNRPDTAPPVTQRPDSALEPSVVTARPSLDTSIDTTATTTLKLSSGPISSKSSEFTKADNSMPNASSFVTDRVKVVSRDGTFRMDVSSPPEQMVPADKGPISHERTSRSSVLRADSCNGGATCVSEDDNENMRWLDPTKYKRVASGGSQREAATRGASVTRGVSLPRSSTDDRLLQQERYTAMSDVFTTGHIQVRQSRIFPMQMEKKDRSFGLEPQSSTGLKTTVPDMNTSKMRRGSSAVQEKVEVVPVMNEEDILDGLLQQHSSFCNALKPRLTKLQVVKKFWIKNDIKGSIEALTKMADNSVVVDVANIITDKSDVLTLEVCTLLLPLLNALLSSELDRYSTVAISLLLLIVKAFGPVIRTTRSASPCFGVDLHAEERFERCNECYVELQAISQKLAPLLRRGGDVGKKAQDLSIAILEV